MVSGGIVDERIDGHEREDVVEYRKRFVERWLTLYTPRMATYMADEKGNITERLPTRDQNITLSLGVPFRLILVTHDESTFYANDQRKILWQHPSHTNTPQPKNEGTSIMASDFMTSEWGRLTCWIENEDGSRCITTRFQYMLLIW